MDDRQHDLRVVEVVLQDIPDRQRVVHRLQQPHRDRMERLLELGVAVEEELIRRERVFELERGILRVHRHQHGQQLLQTGRHFIRDRPDQKEHGVELIEKRVAPRGAPNRLLIYARTPLATLLRAYSCEIRSTQYGVPSYEFLLRLNIRPAITCRIASGGVGNSAASALTAPLHRYFRADGTESSPAA